jgi:hypothetical protein
MKRYPAAESGRLSRSLLIRAITEGVSPRLRRYPTRGSPPRRPHWLLCSARSGDRRDPVSLRCAAKLAHTAVVVHSPSFRKNPNRIPALQFLMPGPALLSRFPVSLRTEFIQLRRQPGQRQFATATLGPFLHGRSPHPRLDTVMAAAESLRGRFKMGMSWKESSAMNEKSAFL